MDPLLHWCSSRRRAIALLTCIAALVAAALSLAALCKTDWRTVDGLPNEQVAPGVFFEHLRVGETKTCVTLRLLDHETRQWKTRETCYTTFLREGVPPTTTRDLVTGQQLILSPVCSAERDWVARKLGIPDRVHIVEIWDLQCAGLQTANVLCYAFGLVGALWLASQTYKLIAHKPDDPECGDVFFSLLAAIPMLLYTFPTLAWLFVMDITDSNVGVSLQLQIIAVVILAWVWGFHVGYLVLSRGFERHQLYTLLPKGLGLGPSIATSPVGKKLHDIHVQ
ncbi:hypothetical protein PINS_up012482 [Pythium insidiosum]|nr:hypothetical protein PINS_up012482 [Pythium insidiosum]